MVKGAVVSSIDFKNATRSAISPISCGVVPPLARKFADAAW
jgi:hypothetical protein